MAHAGDPEPDADVHPDGTNGEEAEGSEEAPPPPPLPKRQKQLSPGQVDNLIAIDARMQMAQKRFSFLDPYEDWKLRLLDRTGFGFGIDYTAVGLAATETLNDYGAAGGIVRAFASWKVIRSRSFTGSFVFKGEHRHSYTNVAPAQFAPNIGYVGSFVPPFNKDGFRLTNLYWLQRFFSDRMSLFAGYLDPPDYLDVYLLSSPFLHFLNLAFSTGSATMAVPQSGLGFVLRAWITKNIYVLGSISDMNADPTRPGKTFSRFFTTRQHFKSIELGWSPGGQSSYLGDVHVTYWHADPSQRLGTPSGWGIAGSFTYNVENKAFPFVRGGYSRDGGTLLQGSVSTGVGFTPVTDQDLLGFAFNWGRPNPDTFGGDLRDQYTFELFYRLQIANQIAITPDVQLIVHPALNPSARVAWVLGLRMRLSL